MVCLPKIETKELKPLDLEIKEDLDDLDLPSGLYSKYYRLTQRTGLKLIRNRGYRSLFESSTESIEELKESEAWERAKAEAYLITRAHRHTKGKYVPRCYGYLPVRAGERWHAAIKVQHITGTELVKLSLGWDENNKIIKKCRRTLRRHWIHQSDMNTNNIILKMDKEGRIRRWMLVDFSPSKSKLCEEEFADSYGGYDGSSC